MPQADNHRLDGRNGQVWQEYLQGRTQEAIAEKVGVSQQRVSQIIKKVRESIPDPDLEEMRRVDIERLEELLAAHFPHALAGDKDATASVLKILERKAKLLGEDAPTRTEMSGSMATYRVEGVDLNALR